MSGLAENYGRIVKRELNAHAAWFPITNTFEVGDFGLIEDGTFRPIGKIRQRYPDIKINTQPGSKTGIDFKTDGTRSVVLDVNGDVTSYQALGNAEGRLKISFSRENSAMIKTEITSIQMTNIAEVADALRKQKDWTRRYKVVSAVYVGANATVLCSREAGTELTLSAKADILQAVEAGKASAALAITSNKSGVFHSVGETGVIALELFKLRLLGGGINTLAVDSEDLIEPIDPIGPGEARDDIY